MKIVALIAHTRTGSTFLRSLLNTHPDAHFFGEVLYPTLFKGGFYEFWRRAIVEDPENLLVPSRGARLFGAFLEELTAPRPEAVVGFDLKIPQVDGLPALHDTLIQRELPVIHLERENALKGVLSERIMFDRLARGDREIHRDYVPEPVRISPRATELLHAVEGRLAADEAIRLRYSYREGLYHSLSYESLADDAQRPAVLRSLFEFLGLDPQRASLDSRLKKQNPTAVRDLVDNFRRLEKRLKGTRLEPMLRS